MARRAVWKWEIPIDAGTRFTIEMPRGARIVSVQTQFPGLPRETGVIWALVDPAAHWEPREFVLVGTGHVEVPHGAPHAGTFQLAGGSLVFHIFEVS